MEREPAGRGIKNLRIPEPDETLLRHLAAFAKSDQQDKTPKELLSTLPSTNDRTFSKGATSVVQGGEDASASRASRRPIHITDQLFRVINSMGLGGPSDWVFVNSVGMQIAENKTLLRLKRHALEADVLVKPNARTSEPWSAVKWHWLRHYHRTRAHVCGIRREVSKLAMGHAADAIHDHYRGVDVDAFHAEYAKFDSGIDGSLLGAT